MKRANLREPLHRRCAALFRVIDEKSPLVKPLIEVQGRFITARLVASISDEIAGRAPASATRSSTESLRSPRDWIMPRFYFDIRDGGALCLDEEGLELANWRAAEIEVAMSLAGMAKELAALDRPHPMGIEVRTDEGPLFQAAFIFEMAGSR